MPDEVVVSKIYMLRGEKVMLDMDLAELYDVEPKQLKRAVRRNSFRFPEDFMFELDKNELEILRSQSGTSNWGGTRYAPWHLQKKELQCYLVCLTVNALY